MSDCMIIGVDVGKDDKTAICLRIGNHVHFIPDPFATELAKILEVPHV